MSDTSIYVYIDQYVRIEPGEPFRLFPFGTIVKGGDKREITPENAGSFVLPHFKPPIKRGSHDEDAPALGFISGLDVRADGIYAIPEYTEAGLEALANGEFRYQSPEIIWDGVIQNADGGATIEGNIIMGAALLHTPALGEAAAFFEASVQSNHGGESNMSDTVTMPASLLDKILGREPEPQDPPQPQRGQEEDYAALVEQAKTEVREEYQAQVEEYEAKIERMEAERNLAGRVAHFAAELAETNLDGDEEAAELLADLEDEQAEAIVKRFKALSAQADKSLEKDIGATGDGSGGDALQAFEAAVQNKMDEANMTRSQAYQAVIRENGDLYREALGNE